jgi:ribonuclease P protein component
LKILTLKKRSSFEFANKNAKKISTKGLVLQVFEYNDSLKELSKEATWPLFGFTATTRMGNAVERNRAKRRLRALVQAIFQKQPKLFEANMNYVFIARSETIRRDYDALLKDAKYALYNVHKEQPQNDGKKS